MEQSTIEIAGISIPGMAIVLATAAVGLALPNLADSVSVYYKTHCLFPAFKRVVDWSDCKLTELDSIKQYVQLEQLNLRNNLLTSLTDLNFCTKITRLVVSNNRLDSLRGLNLCINLTGLDCSDNMLTTLTGLENCFQLRELNCRNNRLTSIEVLEGQTSLTGLVCSGNMITSLESITTMPNLVILRCHDNDFRVRSMEVRRVLDRFGIPYDRNRFVERIRRTETVYTDDQNVHDTHVQKSVSVSIQSLLKDPVPQFSFDFIKNSELSGRVKRKLIKYCTDTTKHSGHHITYCQLLVYVWARIHKSEHRDELLKILAEQVRESKGKCFTGRFNRLLSVLVGFYDDIIIEISDTSRISAIILTIRKQIVPYDAETHRMMAEKQLLAVGYTEDDIESWLEAIEAGV